MKLKGKYKEFILVIILATLMGVVICPECMDSISSIWRLEIIMISIWMVMWYGNRFVSHAIDRYVTWIDNPTKRFAFGIIGSVVFSTSAIISLALLFKYLFDVSLGNNWMNIWISIFVSLIILLFMLSRQFLYSWRNLALREEKMRNELLVSRYEVLKNQINPHFMFNGLNALSALVYEDQDLAVKYINQLSKVLRYVLEAGKQEMVTLEEEIEILNSYIFLHKIRFGDNLIVEIDLNNTNDNYFVAPLVLQMLIENAIKHNEITTDHPLRINLSIEDQYLTVSNNVKIKEIAQHDSTQLGLANIKERYKTLTNEDISIHESSAEFKVSIPLITKKK